MLTIAGTRTRSEGVTPTSGEKQLVRADGTESTPSVTVKILDFGLARLQADETTGELTSDNQVMGTVDYMAPEQATDTHNVDIRAEYLQHSRMHVLQVFDGKAPCSGRLSMSTIRPS